MSCMKRSMLYGLTIVIVFVVASISVPQEEALASVVVQEEVLASPAMTLDHDCSCTYSCQGDITGNGIVDDADLDLLTEVLWGCRCEFQMPGQNCDLGGSCMAGDFNDDGEVNVTDLLILLAN